MGGDSEPTLQGKCAGCRTGLLQLREGKQGAKETHRRARTGSKRGGGFTEKGRGRSHRWRSVRSLTEGRKIGDLGSACRKTRTATAREKPHQKPGRGKGCRFQKRGRERKKKKNGPHRVPSKSGTRHLAARKGTLIRPR